MAELPGGQTLAGCGVPEFSIVDFLYSGLDWTAIWIDVGTLGVARFHATCYTAEDYRNPKKKHRIYQIDQQTAVNASQPLCR